MPPITKFGPISHNNNDYWTGIMDSNIIDWRNDNVHSIPCHDYTMSKRLLLAIKEFLYSIVYQQLKRHLKNKFALQLNPNDPIRQSSLTCPPTAITKEDSRLQPIRSHQISLLPTHKRQMNVFQFHNVSLKTGKTLARKTNQRTRDAANLKKIIESELIIRKGLS